MHPTEAKRSASRVHAAVLLVATLALALARACA